MVYTGPFRALHATITEIHNTIQKINFIFKPHKSYGLMMQLKNSDK